MNEEWKELKGNREIYLISNKGNVKTKSRPGARGTTVKGHDLIKTENSNGYLRVNMHLENENKSSAHLIHRLVADSFIPKIKDKDFVNHIDGDKHNNSVDNLEWCSRSENERHAWKTGLKNNIATKGELHGMHKLRNEDVIYIRNNHKRNGGIFSTGELAKQFSVNPQTITEIVSNRIWKHI